MAVTYSAYTLPPEFVMAAFASPPIGLKGNPVVLPRLGLRPLIRLLDER